jgi:hypothetical protein
MYIFFLLNPNPKLVLYIKNVGLWFTFVCYTYNIYTLQNKKNFN